MELTTLGILISAGIFIVGLGSLIFVALSVGFSLTNSRLNKLEKKISNLEAGQVELKQLIRSELRQLVQAELKQLIQDQKS